MVKNKKKSSDKTYAELVNEALMEQNKKGYIDVKVEKELYKTFVMAVIY